MDTGWRSGDWQQELGCFTCFYPMTTVCWVQGLGANTGQTVMITFKRFLSSVGHATLQYIHKIEYSH